MAYERQSVDPEKITPLLRHKWSATALDEGYIPFPKRLLRCAGRIFRGKQRLGQLRVVLALADYARPDQKRRPTLQYLAFVTGMPRARVLQCLEELEQRGLVAKQETTEGMRIDYAPLVDRIVKLTEDD